MNFELSSDHQLLSDTLRRYFMDHASVDKRNESAYTGTFHSAELWKGLVELGMLGAFVTEEHGGLGGSAGDIAVVFEEVGRALCAEPLLGVLLGLRLLTAHDQNQAAEAVMSGQQRVALAVFEPGVSHDLSCLESTAVCSDGQWYLSGRKTSIYGAPGAELVLVVAKTDQGTGVFLVRSPDMIVSSMVDGGGIAELRMQDLPAECLSEQAQGVLEDTLNLGRIALCAEAVGAMDWLVNTTIDYLKQRQQFGKPLSSFQVLQHRVVDMVNDLEQARSIMLLAATSFATADQIRHTAMAKNLIGRVATRIAEECIQLHGGIGMTWEYPGSHYAKRLIMIDHQLGDRFDHASTLARTL